jgi:rRNA processing protein Krr1/Pno1
MKRSFIVMLIAAFFLAACGSGLAARQESTVGYYDESFAMGGGAPAYPADMLPAPTMMAYAPEEYARAADGSVVNVEAAARERMVVKNAEMTVVVKDPEASMTEISALAESMGGYVVSSNLYQAYAPNGGMVPEANVVIRIPAEKLEEAMQIIKEDAVEVQAENVNGQDVTAQYVDLESQLKNLEAAEAQLTEIMKDATDTEDVLNVYNQLVSIRGQIESIKGQMKYYEESSSTSSISVRLVAEQTIQTIGPWEPGSTAEKAVRDLIEFWQDFVDFLITLVLKVIPMLLTVSLVFVLPIWLIVRAVRNANRRRKAAAEAKPETK